MLASKGRHMTCDYLLPRQVHSPNYSGFLLVPPPTLDFCFQNCLSRWYPCAMSSTHLEWLKVSEVSPHVLHVELSRYAVSIKTNEISQSMSSPSSYGTTRRDISCLPKGTGESTGDCLTNSGKIPQIFGRSSSPPAFRSYSPPV